MSGVSVLQHFEVYQKSRVSFVQAVADAATRPQNIEVMQNAGVMQLLRPLLLDNVRTTPPPQPSPAAAAPTPPKSPRHQRQHIRRPPCSPFTAPPTLTPTQRQR